MSKFTHFLRKTFAEKILVLGNYRLIATLHVLGVKLCAVKCSYVPCSAG